MIDRRSASKRSYFETAKESRKVNHGSSLRYAKRTINRDSRRSAREELAEYLQEGGEK